MTLRTLQPTPTWDADAHESTVEVFEELAETGATVSLWCRDNCPDCRRELPDFAAALEAAAFPEDRLRVYPVDDDNEGERTDEYGVERIPCIVVERGGEELARFVEEESLPAATYLAEELRESGTV
ncbi:thioredoxin [Halobacteriales archaeon QS_1_68_20]|nr:MAG: thioredoxin [Halobacteriales archaeon QS_1_68_20]